LVRVPRHGASVLRAEVPLGGLIDNITWTPEGALLCCVQVEEVKELFAKVASPGNLECPFQATRIDPATLETNVLVADMVPDFFATTMLQVGEREIWASSAMGDRILAFDL
jgi:hypothetical protein